MECKYGEADKVLPNITTVMVDNHLQRAHAEISEGAGEIHRIASYITRSSEGRTSSPIGFATKVTVEMYFFSTPPIESPRTVGYGYPVTSGAGIS